MKSCDDPLLTKVNTTSSSGVASVTEALSRPVLLAGCSLPDTLSMGRLVLICGEVRSTDTVMVLLRSVSPSLATMSICNSGIFLSVNGISALMAPDGDTVAVRPLTVTVARGLVVPAIRTLRSLITARSAGLLIIRLMGMRIGLYETVRRIVCC